MEWIIKERRELSFSWIELRAVRVGEDVAVWVYGGEKPHIGCTVQAIPRLSLTGDGSFSSTSSVLNVPGHKDDVICKKVAETLCMRYHAVTVCFGGFHMDHITMGQIVEVLQAVEEMVSGTFVTEEAVQQEREERR